MVELKSCKSSWCSRWVILIGAGAVAVGFLLTHPAIAGEAARRGAGVVEQWCRSCHLQATAAADPDMAPPFEVIVQRPGRDRWYLQRYLLEDHFPMTTYRLFDSEKADVLAYLIALQNSNRE